MLWAGNLCLTFRCFLVFAYCEMYIHTYIHKYIHTCTMCRFVQVLVHFLCSFCTFLYIILYQLDIRTCTAEIVHKLYNFFFLTFFFIYYSLLQIFCTFLIHFLVPIKQRPLSSCVAWENLVAMEPPSCSCYIAQH